MFMELRRAVSCCGCNHALLLHIALLHCRFQRAWLCFLALQHIDYAAQFKCVCPDEEKYRYIIVDGIVIGPKKSQVSAEVLVVSF